MGENEYNLINALFAYGYRMNLDKQIKHHHNKFIQ